MHPLRDLRETTDGYFLPTYPRTSLVLLGSGARCHPENSELQLPLLPM